MADDSAAGNPSDLELPGCHGLNPGWGRERLMATAPGQVAEVGFEHAPALFRSDRLPEEVREAFADLWDATAAEVVDFVNVHGVERLRTRAGRRALWKRLEVLLARAQRLSIGLGHAYPLDRGRWGHRTVGVVGSGGVAAGEQVIAGASVFTGPTSALIITFVGAAMTELLEVYVATSARVERYRFAARSPSVQTIAADMGAVYGATGLGSRPADRRVVEEAMRVMLTRVVRRAQWRFADALVPVVGPVIAGAMTGSAVTRTQSPALRELDELERGRPG